MKLFFLIYDNHLCFFKQSKSSRGWLIMLLCICGQPATLFTFFYRGTRCISAVNLPCYYAELVYCSCRKAVFPHTSSPYSDMNNLLFPLPPLPHTESADKGAYFMCHIWFDKWQIWVTGCLCETEGGKIPSTIGRGQLWPRDFCDVCSEKCVCLGVQGRGKIEIITQSIVSHSVMRQRCVFAWVGDECGAAWGFSRS